ncbi:hypothetical protein [Priestia aryabhattai]|uniref:hypothetical protein n=1 Tax=Priestia aryabhattai TaxID=412384 RepID=UPI003CF60DDE
MSTIETWYHGTSKENAEKIMENDFDLNFFRKGKSGKGVYFSNSKEYVKRYGKESELAVVVCQIDMKKIKELSSKQYSELINEANNGNANNKKLYINDKTLFEIPKVVKGSGFYGISFPATNVNDSTKKLVIFDLNANVILSKQLHLHLK